MYSGEKMGTTSELGLGKLGRRVTRMLRAEATYSNASAHCENTFMTSIIYDGSHEDQSAMLSAERRKGEALIESQKHRFF